MLYLDSMLVNFNWLIVLFNFYILFNFLFVYQLLTKEYWNLWLLLLSFSISPVSSVSFCLGYFEALFLCAYIFIIAIFFLMKCPFHFLVILFILKSRSLIVILLLQVSYDSRLNSISLFVLLFFTYL